MRVELKLGTRNDPGAAVSVTANIRFTDVAAFDKWLKAQKVARDWLRKELEKK